MIEIDGQLESGTRGFVGPAGVSGPQLDPGQPNETNRLRILRERFHLSVQQARVAASIAAGHSNREIACDLGLAEGTVRALSATVFERLAVSGRAGFMRWIADLT